MGLHVHRTDVSIDTSTRRGIPRRSVHGIPRPGPSRREMVQILIDYRHLARVRAIDLARCDDGDAVRAVFAVASRVSGRSRTFSAKERMPPGTTRKSAISLLWTRVLGENMQTLKAFVADSAKFPARDEPFDMFPLGDDDDDDLIDAALVTGTLDGSAIRPNSLTSAQVTCLDAAKLIGTIHPDRMRDTGLTFDSIGGPLCGSRLAPRSVHA